MPAIQAPPCHVERLPNGFTTAVVTVPQRHQVLVSLWVRVGSRFERPADNGVSHLLEHVLFRGNEAFADADALNRAFESVGSMLNAETGVEATEYYLTAHPERLEAALAYLASFVRTPTFADVVKERAILLDELQYDYNEHGELVNTGVQAARLLWPEHPLGQSVGGVPEMVESLNTAALQAHHRRYYTPARMVLGVAGDVTPEQVFARVREHFGGWEAPAEEAPAAEPAPEPRSGGPYLHTVADSDNQFHLQLSFGAPGYNDPDELATAMLVRVLDDGPTTRLQRVIREDKALVYHIAAGYTGYWDTGALDVSTSVRAERLEELLRALLAELAAFREHGPGEEELERARQRYLFDLAFEQDSLSAQLDRQAWPLLYAEARDAETERRAVEALTCADLHALAQRLLARRRLHLVLVGPVDATVERTVRRALWHF